MFKERVMLGSKLVTAAMGVFGMAMLSFLLALVAMESYRVEKFIALAVSCMWLLGCILVGTLSWKWLVRLLCRLATIKEESHALVRIINFIGRSSYASHVSIAREVSGKSFEDIPLCVVFKKGLILPVYVWNKSEDWLNTQRWNEAVVKHVLDKRDLITALQDDGQEVSMKATKVLKPVFLIITNPHAQDSLSLKVGGKRGYKLADGAVSPCYASMYVCSGKLGCTLGLRSALSAADSQ